MAATDHHLASAETSDLLVSTPSDDDILSLNCVTISTTGSVRYTNRCGGAGASSARFSEFAASASSASHSNSAAATAVLSRVGPKYWLFTDGDVQMCRCSPTRMAAIRLLRSECMRRWEDRHLILGTSDMCVQVPFGSKEYKIPYGTMEDIEVVPHWDTTGHKFCIRIATFDYWLFVQTNSLNLRDRLFYSLRWKRGISKFWRTFLRATRCRDFLVCEFKEMIDLAVTTPLLDDFILEFPLDVLSTVLDEGVMATDRQSMEELFSVMVPLLDNCTPTPRTFDFFSKYCCRQDLTSFVLNLFTPVVYRILKHNLDIGRHAKKRLFVVDFIESLRMQRNGNHTVWNFVKSVHGTSSVCPHLRILPNMVSVCIAMVHNYYEEKEDERLRGNILDNEDTMVLLAMKEKLLTYLTIMKIMSEYSDWLDHLACLLQPVPFPHAALKDDLFMQNMNAILIRIADHDDCNIHSAVLGVRDERDGWFDHFCPGSGFADNDQGHLYSIMLRRLIGCCGRKKQFLQSKLKMLGAWRLLAQHTDPSAVKILVVVLEYDICSDDVNRDIVTTLQSTDFGRTSYAEFCLRQLQLKEIQQKSGPTQLTLPPKSTDADLSKLLGSGSFGNLESLTLAFTNVTSACALDIVKLPSLQHLSLWSTQFGDAGVELLSEHLQRLEVLNLCETPVTDKGIRCLTALKRLRILNLNSTNLSEATFKILQKNLPSLEDCDIRYTDAW